jgi:SAM-dependent methyltransferase
MTDVQHGSKDTTEDRSDYWDEYYATRATTRRPLPSQFATFVAGELERPYRLIELGCGNGRDSIFFSSYGHDVTGVDGSAAAVKACTDLAAALGEPATFVQSAIDDPGLAERLRRVEGPHVLYARFFVHAITDHEEESFLDLAAAVTSPGDLLAVEYRTIRDQVGAKETQTHFRRFVLPATFQARALGRGFEVTYAVEGYGFAKYRHDDAYVARTIFRRA